MRNSRLPGQHTWAVGYYGDLYTSRVSGELDAITWHLGSRSVQSEIRDSECVSAAIENEVFDVTCQFDNVTSQLTSTLVMRDELTSEDDRVLVKFEAEGKTNEDGIKEKTSIEVIITVKGSF